ncbi:hypothetical protein EYD45_04980 [Hyunsoonleella flava]|uniref:Uncharacterized protein n=1 Tax=Hyunsoonleella flava TaxID=2527939 RepID=A0A4Q9FFQ3_9FLAO|nr:hypothetical protein [Hyunsoonleella flava]TBN05631.1 hypothetical protein EYD45_04980 [Hyunsoonleella flava]
MNIRVLFMFLSFANILFCQNIADVKEIEGVWIAEDFYNSFEKTHNIHKSKNSFNSNYPVALRINPKETLKGKVYIGYQSLHDHLLHAEESKYVVIDNDTLGKKGCFEIDFSRKDSLNHFLTSEILYFNHDCKSYLTWDKDVVILYRPKSGELKSETIRYKRVSNKFHKNYQYPNPLYFYTRKKLLVGNYILKEYKGRTLTKSLKIKPNGLVSGYSRFKKMYAYYSTDIYCGLPTTDEHLMLFDDVTKEDSKSIHFVIIRPNSRTVFLYEMYPRRPEFGQELDGLGEPKYVLIKK